MKNILILGMSNNLGGIEVFIKNYYLAIDNSDVSFRLLVWNDNICFEEEFRSKGIKIDRLYCHRRRNPVKYYREIKKYLEKHAEIDIIHLHLQSASSISVAVLGKKLGKKIIVHSHSSKVNGWFSTILHTINKFRIRHLADYYLACSVKSGVWMFGEKIVNSNKFKVLNNAVEVKKFNYDEKIRKEVRQELNIPENAKVVGHVGRFVDVKNHSFLLKIFKEVLCMEPLSLLLSVGAGPLESEIKEQAKELSVDQRVVFTGVRLDLDRIYQAMDVFVMPSKYEGFPISVIEAQASGLSCLLSNNITKEVKINENVTYEDLTSDPQNWASEVVEYFKMQRLPVSKNKIAVDYDLNKNIKILMDIYEEL